MRFSIIAIALLLAADIAHADSTGNQSRDDAWWTGPLLAASPGSLTPGHYLIEPYLFMPHSNEVGSQSYLLYGLTDKVGVGFIPRFSTDGGVGDLSLQAQYGLTTFNEGSWIPTTAVVLQETLPTAPGPGPYSTTVALYSQYFFWMPNGRILRTRFDVSYQTGDSIVADAAGEYSATRHWVLAMDAVYEKDGSTHNWSLAPAIEYNFNSRVGIIAGAKITVAGPTATARVIPVAAINIVI